MSATSNSTSPGTSPVSTVTAVGNDTAIVKTERSARLGPALAVVVAVQLVLLSLTAFDPAKVLTLVPGLVDGDVSFRIAALAIFAQVSALAATAISLWRVYLVARYRPVADVGDAALPKLTVVVPAYNEGRQVLLTLRSLAASQYPRDRLQIIAVDDGSADDTWSWIKTGAEELGDLVTAYRCPKNGGKKHALVEGFKRATGSIIVTIDSDCEVLPDTLRLLVAPFTVDSGVGAVAGNVRVLNKEQGALPKMLDACFTTAFDFIRAGESEAGSVMCCPGALSAWRKDLLDTVVDEWLGQTFFGQPAAIGEDRALTNLIIRSGANVRYQSTSVILTQVPATYKVLKKMFMRWARSNVRESLVLGRFVFGKQGNGPDGRARRGLQVMFVWSVISMITTAAAFVPTVIALVLHPQLAPYLLAVSLLGAIPTAAVCFASRDRETALWALPWGVYSLLLTSWIAPAAILTMHKSGWLTRAPVAPMPVVLPTRTAPMLPAGSLSAMPLSMLEHSGTTARAA